MFELPVILSGQTIGPINGCFDSFFANYALNGVNVITLRENESIHTLKRLCVNKPVIQVTADDSVNLIPAALPVLDQIIVTEYSRIKRPIIGLNIFGLNLHGSEADFLNAKKLLAKVADYLIDKYDVTIVFVPMQYSDPDDRIAESETISLMANKKNVFVLTKVHSYSEIKGLVGRMDLVIGFRYHFITFAVTSGVPAIGLYSNSYYSRKICGILSLVGLPDNALNLRKIGYDDLILLVENQFANKASLRAMLVDQTVKLQAKSLLSVKYAVALLK
jgi:polysaccharide pyruvyl transferase WcaK-like protein